MLRRATFVLVLALLVTACTRSSSSSTNATGPPSAGIGQVLFSPTPAATPAPDPPPPTFVRTYRVADETHETFGLAAVNDAIWVGVREAAGSSLVEIDPATGARTGRTVALEGAPGDQTGGRGMIAAAGSIWVAGTKTVEGHAEAILQRMDPSAAILASTIDLGHGVPMAAAANARGIWVGVAGTGTDRVVLVDARGGPILGRVLLEGTGIRSVAAVDDAVLVKQLIPVTRPEGQCSALTSIDPATLRIIAHDRVNGACVVGPLVAWRSQIWTFAGSALWPLVPATVQLSQAPCSVAGGQFPGDLMVGSDRDLWYAAYRKADLEGAPSLATYHVPTARVYRYFALPNGGTAGTLLNGDLWILSSDGSVTRISTT